jgi:hypothetical protein
MVWQIPTPDRPKLLKTVKSFFLSKGWDVKELERLDGRIDFITMNRGLTYFVTVVDEAQKNFFRMERMIDGMNKDSREIRSLKRQVLIYVLNFRFESISFETLVERQIAAFALDEMDMVTGTAAYLDELPPQLSIREMDLFVGNPKVCIAISGRFYESGDRASAIKWARHSLTLKGGVTVAHSRLFQMYLEEGDLESAERVGQEVFYFQPKNVDFLQRMEKLAIRRNDHEAAAMYRARRAPDKLDAMPVRTFQDLLAKQQAKRALADPAATPPAAVAEKSPKTGIGKFLDRLRGSGSGM